MSYFHHILLSVTPHIPGDSRTERYSEPDASHGGQFISVGFVFADFKKSINQTQKLP
jgi:hypothetical protein